ncbi:hypothetical protein ANCCEY_03727 [Ancylostoma ceylanicum]|uniref:Uncharacterized protein n=1 Tax=Ancylostoma ceylanicum TaxID=53326 RepID=A0A0D6M485_9BILA|nr:hypothetical protein ANCCEY_03727 [Ancylostoma ceylanicum]
MCPNGETAVSGCFPNGGCGSGFECVRHMNLCCPPGGNEIVPSSPHNNLKMNDSPIADDVKETNNV